MNTVLSLLLEIVFRVLVFILLFEFNENIAYVYVALECKKVYDALTLTLTLRSKLSKIETEKRDE